MSDSIRAGHLIFGSGVGGLTILKNGTSVLTASLDYWFRDLSGKELDDVVDASLVTDWRLESRLKVGQLRTPPVTPDDAPSWKRQNEFVAGVPVIRFPLWHVCPLCRRLSAETNPSVHALRCSNCQAARGKFKPTLVQVPLVAACQGGHLQEFPWRQWLTDCNCSEPSLFLRQRGGSGLANFVLQCKTCNSSRRMSGALSPDAIGKCQAKTPWQGTRSKNSQPPCAEPLTGVLRNSASVYFPKVVSSVYIPNLHESVPDDLIELLNGNSRLKSMVDNFTDLAQLADFMWSQSETLKRYNKEQIAAGLKMLFREVQAESITVDELDYRFTEFDTLTRPVNDDRLRTRIRDIGDYSMSQSTGLKAVGLIDTITVTRALTGFNRLLPDETENPIDGMQQLWRYAPKSISRSWLPAIQVKGEGIFLQFQESKIVQWEQRSEIKAHMQKLLDRSSQMRNPPDVERYLTARYVLLHTLSHLLMNRMAFRAGYSVTSLSERIYSRVPSPDAQGMAGLLIYTASGDADGSLGGLVRLSKPGEFEALFSEAIESARWCSSDPVCMELGTSGGQGPDGMNMAACHACAHVPETACESFNLFLDRALVVGSLEDPSLAFFV